MKAYLLAACAAALVAAPCVAFADEAATCRPLADAQSEITALGGGQLRPLSREELLFARGLFVASPPTSPYPQGEEAMIAKFDDGSSTVAFLSHGAVCARMGVAPGVTKLLLEIDKSI